MTSWAQLTARRRAVPRRSAPCPIKPEGARGRPVPAIQPLARRATPNRQIAKRAAGLPAAIPLRVLRRDAQRERRLGTPATSRILMLTSTVRIKEPRIGTDLIRNYRYSAPAGASKRIPSRVDPRTVAGPVLARDRFRDAWSPVGAPPQNCGGHLCPRGPQRRARLANDPRGSHGATIPASQRRETM